MPEGIVLKLKDTSIGVGSLRDGDIDVNKRLSELVAIFILSVSLWHAAEGGPAPRVTRLEITSHSCNGRKPVFYYIQMGYATSTIVSWDGSDARRDCTEVESYTSGRTITGWRYKCEKKNVLDSKSGNLKYECFQLEVSSNYCSFDMGYATQTTKVWDSSNASRDCTWVYRYLTSGRIITGWISKCENKNICSTTLKLRNGRYWDSQFKNCCN
ncbi:unnamed protein product [Mytilus edulis]|uniref:Uncharacterized protein n=1 Tax=Mytilus edulis TaxID=6550 RepID=A0A8S3RQX2_MYTED|nr:unnamed protein product [Mytilus edulis]